MKAYRGVLTVDVVRPVTVARPVVLEAWRTGGQVRLAVTTHIELSAGVRGGEEAGRCRTLPGRGRGETDQDDQRKSRH